MTHQVLIEDKMLAFGDSLTPLLFELEVCTCLFYRFYKWNPDVRHTYQDHHYETSMSMSMEGYDYKDGYIAEF
jgi:hypothetical protein